jgi:small subunit ribosomal protein S1
MSERVEAVAQEEGVEANLQDAAQSETPQQEGHEAAGQEVTGQESTGEEVTEEETSATPVAQAENPSEASPGESAEAVVPGEVDAEVDGTPPDAEEAERGDGPSAVAQDEPAEDSTPDPTERPVSTPAQATESTAEKKIVRTLAVGQQVTGTVKRIADFGAFVDIGVGRDGLIHISELSVRRVGKVTDMLQEGQEVQAWIKQLDRERNRISLTLIDPETKTIRDLEKGDVVTGRVTRLLPYGAFVDIGIGRDALLHVREMAEGFVAKPEDVVKVDEEIEARIIDLSRRRNRVDLSLKGLRPEPESAAPYQDEGQAQEVVEDEEVVEDAFEEVEVLSPMELAFKRAMEAEGMEVRGKKRGRRNRRLTGRDIQDEIISRTLQEGRS